MASVMKQGLSPAKSMVEEANNKSFFLREYWEFMYRTLPDYQYSRKRPNELMPHLKSPGSIKPLRPSKRWVPWLKQSSHFEEQQRAPPHFLSRALVHLPPAKCSQSFGSEGHPQPASLGASWPLFQAGSPAELLDGGGDALEPVTPQAEALEAEEAQERGWEVREAVAAQVEDAQGPAQGGAGQAFRERPAGPQPVVLRQQRVQMRQVQQLGAQHRQPRPAHVQDLQGWIPAP